MKQNRGEGLVVSNNPRNGWITVRPATGAEFNVRAGMVDEILAKVAGDSAVASSGLPAVRIGKIVYASGVLTHGSLTTQPRCGGGGGYLR